MNQYDLALRSFKHSQGCFPISKVEIITTKKDIVQFHLISGLLLDHLSILLIKQKKEKLNKDLDTINVDTYPVELNNETLCFQLAEQINGNFWSSAT